MDNKEVIKHIRTAKRAHLNWVSYAHSLILGMPFKEEQSPMHSTECKFGKWYYGEGQDLKELPSFEEIEQPHNELHETYMEIFRLLFVEKPEEKGLFAKWFGKKTTIDMDKNRKQAEDLCHVLKKHSEVVVAALGQLEEEVGVSD